MLHTKIQASEPSGSEDEVFFNYLYMYFYDLNTGPPGAGSAWALQPSFDQI